MPVSSNPPVEPVQRAGGYFFRRLFVTALAAALPVVALFAWSLVLSVQDARRQSTASVLQHSQETARRIEATLSRLNVVADVLLAREEVRGMDAARCGEALKDLPRVDPLILNVGLFDLQGRPLCLARSPAVMQPSFRDSPWFQQALAQDARVLTAPYFSPASQRRVLSMGSPVRDAQQRRIGILGLSIDLERLSGALQSERLPPGAAVAVVAPDGMLVARSPEPARWIGTRVPAEVMAASREAAAAGGSFVNRGVDGQTRNYGFAPVASVGWRVVAGVPTEHVSSLVRQSSQRGLAVLALALVLGVVSSWLSARWLARPLQALAATARRLADGDDSARADESQRGEVGQLGAEFNHMVQSLVASRNVERASTARFLQLFNVIPVAAAVVEAGSGTLLEVNDTFCREHGLPRARALGRPLPEVQAAAAGASLPPFWRRGAGASGVRAVEGTLRRPDGEERTVLTSAEAIEWHGRPAWLCVHVDVTEGRRAERLRAADVAKTEFLSRMSHELRTPLNAILGLTQLLLARDGQPLDAAAMHQLDLVRRAGLQLQALIDDVLDVARIESGSLAVHPQPLDIGQAVDEALQLSEGAAHETGVRLGRGVAEPGGLRVLADPTRLRQVLLNLVSNGIKYNRRGGEVEVRVAEAGAMVRIAVRDTGIGLSAAQQAGLFEPFNRLGRENGPVPGTGIGLALTRSLVLLQGGTLTVSSEEGRGTTVTVMLPAAPPESRDGDAAPGASLAAAPGEPPPPSGRVLYVEDNEVNALIVEQLLSAWPGVHLTVAADGHTGLRLAREQPPHVLLLDMQLPDMDGIAVLQQLRADAATRGIPVIVLSASTMPDEVAAARAAGADDFWAKPFDFETFLAGLRQRLPR